MKKALFIKILIASAVAISGNQLFAQNEWEASSEDTYMTKLATNLQSANNSLRGVFKKFATTYGIYQINELEKMNPQVKKVTRLEVSFFSTSKKADTNSSDENSTNSNSNLSTATTAKKMTKKEIK